MLRKLLWVPRILLFSALGAGIWAAPSSGLLTGAAMERLWGTGWLVQALAVAFGLAQALCWFYLMLDGTVGKILCWIGGID